MSNSKDEKTLDRGQKPGDILLFLHPEGTSLVISWLTRSKYYHVAICQDTLHVVESRPRGVVCRDLRTKEGGHTFVVIPQSNGSGKKALDWAESKIGDKYDSMDLVVILFDRIFTHLHINYKPPKNEFSCGEFVATAFEETGSKLFADIKSTDVVPGDFERLIPSAKATT
ncbi:MAG: hypothetical protein ABJA67_14145 [Chthonomonadales bacterium]